MKVDTSWIPLEGHEGLRLDCENSCALRRSPCTQVLKCSNICLPDLPYSECMNKKKPPAGVCIKLLDLKNIQAEGLHCFAQGLLETHSCRCNIVCSRSQPVFCCRKSVSVRVCACVHEFKTCQTHFTWRLYPGCLSFTQSSFKTDGIGPYDSLSPSKLWVHNTISLRLSCLSKPFLRTALSVQGWAVHPTRFFCSSKFEVKYEEKPPVSSRNCL